MKRLVCVDSFDTLRCSLLLVLLSMMGASWLLENPARSAILLHPWLQWAIKTIQKVSGTDASLKDFLIFTGFLLVGIYSIIFEHKSNEFNLLGNGDLGPI